MTDRPIGRLAIRDDLLDHFDAASTLEELADLVLRHLMQINGIDEKFFPAFKKRFAWADGQKGTLAESAAELGLTRERLRQVSKKLEKANIDLLVPPRVVMGLLAIIRHANSEEEFWEAARNAKFFAQKKVWPLDAVKELIDLVASDEVTEEFSSRLEEIRPPSNLASHRSALRKLRSGSMGWLDLEAVSLDQQISIDEARWLTHQVYAQVLGTGRILVVNERLPGPFLTAIAKVFAVTESPTIDELFEAVERAARQRSNRPVGTHLERKNFLVEIFGSPPAVPESFRELFEQIQLLKHEVWFTQIFRKSTYGLMHRDEVIEYALKDDFPTGSIGAYLSYSPIVRPFSDGVYGLIGTRPNENEIRFVRQNALDNRHDPNVKFDFIDAQKMKLSFTLNFSIAGGGAIVVDEELKGVIGPNLFGVECNTGDLESNGNLAISSGFLMGLSTLAFHAMKAHGRKVGDRVNVIVDFDTLTAKLEITEARH